MESDTMEIPDESTSGYHSQLTPAVLRELGEINLVWFDDLTESRKSENCENDNTQQTSSQPKTAGPEGSTQLRDVDQDDAGTTSPRVGQVANQGCYASTPVITDLGSPAMPGYGGTTPRSASRITRRASRMGSQTAASSSTSHPLNLPATVSTPVITSHLVHLPAAISTPVIAHPEFPNITPSTMEGKDRELRTGNMRLAHSGCPVTTPIVSPWMLKTEDRRSAQSEDLEAMLARTLDSDSLRTTQSVGDSEGFGREGSQGTDPVTDPATDSLTDPSALSQRASQRHKGLLKSLMQRTPSGLSAGKENFLHRSLGLNLNESGMSWTSSLATPPVEYENHKGIPSTLKKVSPRKPQEFPVGAARKLFSPGAVDTDSEETLLNTTAEDEEPMPALLRPKEQKAKELPPQQTSPSIPKVKEDMHDAGQQTPKIKVAEEDVAQNVYCENTAVKNDIGKASRTSLSEIILSNPRTNTASSVSLNILGDLFDTPPSRTSLRKPPPKKRTQRKRYSAPCNMQREVGEDGSSKGLLDRVLQLSPSEGVVQNLSMGFVPNMEESDINSSLELEHRETDCNLPKAKEAALGSKLTENNLSGRAYPTDDSSCVKTKHNNCDDNKSADTDKPASINFTREPSDDLIFTQLSPSALEAIYEVVDETENPSAKSPSDEVDKGMLVTKQTDNLEKDSNESNDHHLPNASGHIKGTVGKVDDAGKESSESPKETNCDDFFTQLSPSALQSIMTESDQIEEQTKRTTDSVKNPPSGTKAVKQDYDDRSRTPLTSGTAAKSKSTAQASPRAISTPLVKPMSATRPIGLARKTKRFSYPSTSQISSVCPKTVFGFQSDSASASKVKLDDDNQTAETNPSTENVDVEKSPVAEKTTQVKPPYMKRRRDLGFTTLSAYSKQTEVSVPSNKQGDRRAPVTPEKRSPRPYPYTSKAESKLDSRTPSSISASSVSGERKVINNPRTELNNTGLGTVGTGSPQSNAVLISKVQNDRDFAREFTKTRNIFKDGHISNKEEDKSEKEGMPKNSSAQPTSTKTEQETASDTSKGSGKPEDVFVGFKTASGQKVETDASKLQKFRAWFDEDVSGPNDKAPKKDPVQLLGAEASFNPQPAGFTCASGKKINIKRETIDKFAKWFEEDLDPETLLQSRKADRQKPETEKIRHTKPSNCQDIAESVKVSEHKGFQTAAGKKIEVSADTSEKYASWFEEPTPGEIEMKNTETSRVPANVTGFQTAGGKSLSISSSAVEKYQKLFEDDLEAHNLSGITEAKEAVGNRIDADCAAQKQDMGSKTAKGRDLSLKHEALAKFEKMFNEDDMTSNKFSGFQKATGKCVPEKDVLASVNTHSMNGRDIIRSTENEEKDEFDSFLESLKRKSSNKEKDYSKLPKGFRPFKRPRMMEKPKEENPEKPTTPDDKEQAHATVNVNNKPEDVKEISREKATKAPTADKQRDGEGENDDMFNDSLDNFTYTQITEATNCAAAFMASEDDTSFTQVQSEVEQPKEDKIPTVTDVSPQRIPQQDKIIKNMVSEDGKMENFIFSPPRKTAKMTSQSEDQSLKCVTDFPSGESDASKPQGKMVETEDSDKEKMLENFNPATIQTGFVGFATASGKTLKPSSQAIKKVKSIFDSCNESDRPLGNSEDSSGILDTKAVSYLATQKSSTVPAADVSSDSCPASSSGAHQLTSEAMPVSGGSEATTYSLGFQTAAGRKVTVSEESLLQVREMMQSAQQQEYPKPEEDTSHETTPVKVPEEVETAKVPVVVNIEAVASTSHAASLIDDSSTANPSYSGVSQIASLPLQDSVSKGDTTISLYSSHTSQPKPVSQTADAVVPDIQDNQSPGITGKFQGFQSASGKNIAVSSAALQKVKGLFDEQPSCTEGTSAEIDTENRALGHLQSQICNTKEPEKGGTRAIISPGFTTASGKSVTVSSESLSQARQVLADEEPDPHCFEKDEPALVPAAESNNPPSNLVNEQNGNQGRFDKVQNKTGIKASEQFGGFATASGKKLSVSTEALNHVRQFFNEKDEENTVPSTEFVGFATASGKRVNVSASSLERARKNLKAAEDEISTMNNEEDPNTTLGIKRKERKTSNMESGFSGFQTAGGTPVAVSEDALKKVRGKLADSGDYKETTHSVPRDSKTSLQTNDGASDGLRGTHTIRSSSLQTAEGPVTTSAGYPREDKDVIPLKEQFAGFSTAGGKKVSVSTKSLNHVKQFFSDIEEESSEHNKETFGFATASGKKVNVSSSSLEKARNPLRAAETEAMNVMQNPEEVSSAATSERLEGDKKPSFGGFQTAGGTLVPVSTDALKRARILLYNSDEEKGNSHSINDLPEAESSPESTKKARQLEKSGPTGSFMGFQTAGGNSVSVSADSLKRARTLLHDSDEEKGNCLPEAESSPKSMEPSEQLENSVPKGSFMGFQTAGGAAVKISDAALNQVKDLFKDDQNEETEGPDSTSSNNTSKSQVFTGFETAKGSKVSVSGDSLRQIRSRLDESGTPNKAKELLSGKNKSEMKEGTSISPVKQEGEKTTYGDEEILFELSESSKAFLADGADEAFDEAAFSADRREKSRFTTSTPVTAQHKTAARVQRGQNPAHRVMPGVRPKLKPVASTPEDFFSDRCSMKQSLAHLPLVSAPEKDVLALGWQNKGFRWRGPTSYKALSDSNPKHDVSRPPPSINPNPTTTTPRKSTPSKPKSETSFTTPYKKQAFTTPSKSTPAADSGASGGFQPPVKSATPAKRTASDAQLDSGSSKRAKVEEVDGDVERPNENEGKITEPAGGDEMPDEDWEGEQDSLSNALATTDLDGLVREATEEHSTHGARRPAERARVGDEVVKARTRAKVGQAQRIKKKRDAGGVRPVPGAWFRERSEGRRGLSLREAVGGWTPRAYNKQQLYAFGVRESTLTVTSACAEEHRFWAGDFYGETVTRDKESVRVGDGAVLVWDERSTAGKDEFCNALLDMEGVDPRLTSREWVYNHYRWLVWKLAAMEVAFPQVFGGRWMTPDKVMLQLKYRYDREVDNSQRSAIKKIFEHDDTPAKSLVLCVSRIVSAPDESKMGTSGAKSSPAKETHRQTTVVELSDGWYPIRAVLDPALSRLVSSGRLHTGDKLCVSGAELVGSQDAAPPLQAPADTMLKISANSCRRARWDARLGYNRHPQPPPLPLCSLYPDGGTVSCVDVIVVRVYPTQYMERPPGGGSAVFRTARSENLLARRAEVDRQRLVEEIYTKLQAEFEKRASGPDRRRSRRSGRGYTSSDIAALTTGQDIDEAMKGAADPGYVEGSLTDHQVSLLTDYRRRLQEELHREMEVEFRVRMEALEEKKPKRNVTPLVKIRLAGCSTKDIDTKTDSILTVWRPAEDVLNTLTEGKRFRMYSLGAAESRGRLKGSAVSLTAQRMTRYEPVPVDDNFLDLIYEPREVTDYPELVPDFSPPYGEVDIVGVVVHVSPTTSFDRASGDEGQVQTVYVADHQRHLLAITVWGGLPSYALEDVLRPRTQVTFANLQHRPERAQGPGQSKRLPALTLSETTSVSTNPKEKHLRTALGVLSTALKVMPKYVDEMKEQLHGHMTPQGSFTPTATPQSLPQRGSTSTPTITSGFLQKGRYQRSVLYRTPSAPTSTGCVGEQGDGPGQAQPGPPQDTTPGSTDLTKGQGGHPLTTTRKESDSCHPPPGLSTPHRTDSPVPGLTTGTFPGGPSGGVPASGGSGADSEDVDPLVAKRRALQRVKAQRLAMYADHSPVTPLHGTVSVKARKAFKMPSSAGRSASPALGRGPEGTSSAGRSASPALCREPMGTRDDSGPGGGRTTGDISGDIGEGDTGGEKLGRKLSFEEEVDEKDKTTAETPKCSKASPEKGNSASDQTPQTELQEQSSTSTQPQDSQGTVPKLCDNSNRIPGSPSVPAQSANHEPCQLSDSQKAVTDTSQCDRTKRPTRTRGRGKRGLDEEGPEGQRQAKRSASLGTLRRKPNCKK